MPKASEVKKNTAIEFNNNVFLIRDIERSVPQGRSGGSLYRMRMYDVASGSKLDHTFKADDMISLADLSHHDVTFSYIDGDEYVFMDVEDYTPYHFNKDTIAEELLFITEETQGLHVLTVDGSPVAIELPSHVDLVIVETDPSIKGASASARTKPATLSTGLTVQVPEYIANGEKIKINTAEHKFMSRSDSKA
ncbi:elongation factor P-like protein YeiP [Shewanella psychrophila]|uniref:Elongation factor P-like protein n=1 Tax=Shewanella psychrophila TaxID=225848 RepID=A0A1S6HJE4_9GAMM|nr:elongation factor P-like protein YeiP [Shewanella psychrophila]AQS35642.1 elongation factor P-like protein YeiP [Shewanella psychrophila]